MLIDSGTVRGPIKPGKTGIDLNKKPIPKARKSKHVIPLIIRSIGAFPLLGVALAYITPPEKFGIC